MTAMGLLKGINIGQHYPLDTVIHHLDPRTKIAVALLFMAAVFASFSPASIALLAVFSLLALAASRIPVPIFWRGTRAVRWLIAFTILLHSFITPGGVVLVHVWRLTATSEGLARGLLMSCRILLMVLTTSLLTLTTSPLLLTDGLERMLSFLRPLGVPTHELALMMTIALRFVPTLAEEADKIAKAQQARGADFTSGNLKQRLEGLLPILVPLFVAALRRADELAIAMEARCYHGGRGRTQFRELQFSSSDYAVSALTLLFCVASLYLSYGVA